MQPDRLPPFRAPVLRRSRLLLGVLASTSMLTAVHAAVAAPAGGQVTSGSGAISQSGATTTITQASQALAINWRSFDVAASETVNFVQPSASSVAVNQILGANGSQILGRLNANGQVWLVNPNGVLFGQGSQVNVGGLLATTLSIASDAGGVVRLSGGGTGAVVNAGAINAPGGYVALVANTVSNTGTITADLGTVALGAGSGATLTLAGHGLVQLQIDTGALGALAENGGLIQADGGHVLLTAGAADALLASVVNNTGVIRARTVQNQNGTIVLKGGAEAGLVNVGGTLDASAPAGGDGGSIETSAAQVKVTDDAQVTTLAANGTAGSWLIDPSNFTVSASGGNITGAALSQYLASTGVEVDSYNDLDINDTVSWSSNLLTLKAPNNINVNAVMTASGSASLSLNPSTTVGANSAVAGGTVLMGMSAAGTVNASTGNAFTGQINFSGSGALTIGGASYTVINSASALQAVSTGAYALGSNIDEGGNANFSPLTLRGNFNGLGHTIGNLNINSPNGSDIGLFSQINPGNVVSNVGVDSGVVSAADYVGEIVGQNLGSILNVYSNGQVTGSYAFGGLVGWNEGSIEHSFSTASVLSSGRIPEMIGGLAGLNSGGASIDNSYYSGSVSGTTNGYFVGGWSELMIPRQYLKVSRRGLLLDIKRSAVWSEMLTAGPSAIHSRLWRYLGLNT